MTPILKVEWYEVRGLGAIQAHSFYLDETAKHSTCYQISVSPCASIVLFLAWNEMDCMHIDIENALNYGTDKWLYQELGDISRYCI